VIHAFISLSPAQRFSDPGPMNLSRWMILAAALAAACAQVPRSPPAPSPLEGRCFLYSRSTGEWTKDDEPVIATRRIRLTAKPANDEEFAGWRVVKPGIGHSFTYWTPNGADSVRIVFSNSVMDATWMRLGITEAGLAGTSELASDMTPMRIMNTDPHGNRLPDPDSITVLRRTRCGWL
jgi:hypothetical protein